MKKTLLITGSLVAVYVLVRNRKLIADKAADIINAATEKLELLQVQQQLLKSKVGEDVSAFLADPSSGEARTRQGF
jgi:hypothetical protein